MSLEPCDFCDGLGWVNKKKCTHCSGNGLQPCGEEIMQARADVKEELRIKEGGD